MSESNEVPFVDECYVGTQSEANVDEKSVQDDGVDDHTDPKEPEIIMNVALSPEDIGQRCLLGVSEEECRSDDARRGGRVSDHSSSYES